MPQALRPSEEKKQSYKTLDEAYRKHKGKGPTYIFGDMNARVRGIATHHEKGIVGSYTFDQQSANPMAQFKEVIENRQMFIDFCIKHELILANTLFNKKRRQASNIQRGRHDITSRTQRRDARTNRLCNRSKKIAQQCPERRKRHNSKHQIRSPPSYSRGKD